MKNKVALAMIVAAGNDDEAPLLAKALASVSKHVDGIFINLNAPKGIPISPKVRRVAEQYTKDITVTEWTGNYVKTRNDNFASVTKDYEWIFWLDTDDTVWQPYKIKEIAAVAPTEVQGIFAQYDYDHDEFGNCTVTHRVLRLVRNNRAFWWKASFEDDIEMYKGKHAKVTVHEILSETKTVKKAFANEFKVIHHASKDKRYQSLLRNINLLEGMYERQMKRKEVDPRVLYYLGREYFNNSQMAEAEPMLVDYLKMSGWAEERAEAWLHLGIIWDSMDRPDAARQAFGHAFLENPKSPRALVELGQLEFREKRYQMSEEYLLMAIDKEVPETAYAVFPMENKYRAYMLLAQTYINMGASKHKAALKYVNKALKLRPFDESAKEAQKLCENLLKVRDRTQAIMRLASLFHEKETPQKMLPILDTLPDDYQDNPAVVTIRQNLQRPKKWSKKSIVIFCGNSAEDIWGPWGLDEGGMGGSEEAVIQMSRLLVKQGWGVTVYATPGVNAGVYEGVEWKSYWTFNPKDTFDIFIAWRMPWFFDIPIKARKNYLWMHDVMDKGEFDEQRLKNIDKVIFVSKYHAELYRGVIPKDKWFVSGNGIDPTQFEIYDGKFERDMHRCLYMSSQVRGLEELYEIWPEVKEVVPDATLDVYYGWKTFLNSNAENPERMEFMHKMQKWAKKLDGVTDGGRLGHDQIAQEIQKSGVLAYPCKFPEVYNISTVKAMAGGCYPVLSDFGCLPDYKDLTTQVHLEKDREEFKKKYKEALIEALLNPISETKRHKMMQEARGKYSWDKTAKGWNEEMK